MQGRDTSNYRNNIFIGLNFVDNIDGFVKVHEGPWEFTEINPVIDNTVFDGYFQSAKNFLGFDDKIKKYEGESPKGNDTVVDTKTGKIYTFNGEWEDKGKKLIQLMSDKFESLLLSADEKSRFKVIHRGT